MIEIEDLSFRYGKSKPILDGLNMVVPKGSIFGFIGANGAGKSTSIRCILGLLKPSSGNIRVFNTEHPDKNIQLRDRIGYLIESPQFYSNLTCYENLLLLKQYLNFDKARIEEVLVMFGLWKYRDYLYSSFSTGMKQRLGIAKSFLTNPELVILDEPLNGLDPRWIFEIRNILKSLNATYGTTIFLSSHILSEMEKVATHIGILKDGKIAFEGDIGGFLKERNLKKIVVDVKGADRQLDFSNLSGIKFNGINENRLEFEIHSDANLNTLFSFLLSNEIQITDISTSTKSLEDIVTKTYGI